MKQHPANSQEMLSTLGLRIVSAATRATVTTAELADLAEVDPAFSLRLLKLVNSPVCGLQRTVLDVRRAVALIGIVGVRNLALGIALSDMTPPGEHGRQLMCNNLRRAVVSRMVAEETGLAPPSDAFTVGLLLDSAYLLWARDDPAAAADLTVLPRRYRRQVEEADGRDHAQAAADFIAEQGLPALMVDAIAHHEESCPPDAALSQVAWIAERFAGVFETDDFAGARAEVFGAAFQLGILPRTVVRILQRTPKAVERAGSAFSCDIDQQPELSELLRSVSEALLDLNWQIAADVRRLEGELRQAAALTGFLKTSNVELARAARTDALTELWNFRGFVELLGREVTTAQRRGDHLSLVIIDVDHFKQINDGFGHQVGDTVLRGIAHRLKEVARGADLVARYGGEEFAVILPDTDADSAVVAAERLRRAVGAVPFQAEQRAISVTASFGVATLCTDQPSDVSCDALIQRADQAMYVAKRRGRDQVVAWTASLAAADGDRDVTSARTAAF